jgi:hypothetical protein
LRCGPFEFDQRQGYLQPLRSLGFVTAESDAAEFAKALLTNAYSGRKRPKILVEADEYCLIDFCDGRHEGIRRIGRQDLPQENDFVPCLYKNVSYGIRDTVIGKKLKALPLGHP